MDVKRSPYANLLKMYLVEVGVVPHEVGGIKYFVLDKNTGLITIVTMSGSRFTYLNEPYYDEGQVVFPGHGSRRGIIVADPPAKQVKAIVLNESHIPIIDLVATIVWALGIILALLLNRLS